MKRIIRISGDELHQAIEDNLMAENKRLHTALVRIQAMTSEYVEANRKISAAIPAKAFWQLAHVEKIAREALEKEGE